MKKVLIIAYFYPPRGCMGTLRTTKFVKYLIQFNWKPIVLTTNRGNGIFNMHEDEGRFGHARIIKSQFMDIFGKTYRRLSATKVWTDPDQPKTLRHDQMKGPVFKKLARLIWAWMKFPDETIDWYPFAVNKAMELVRRDHMDLIYSTSPPETSHLVAFKIKKKPGFPG